MQYAADSSDYSAQVITAHRASLLGVSSVLDVGCASGTWLRVWLECGVTDIHGIDGEYVSRPSPRISQDKFTATDLDCAFDLGRQLGAGHPPPLSTTV
jgi:hypothetical protein